jgi:hypothetical protein
MMRRTGAFGLAVASLAAFLCALTWTKFTAGQGVESPKQIVVGIYDAGSAGGEALGGSAVKAALASVSGIRAKQLKELSPESLRGVNVLVLPAVRRWGSGIDSATARQRLTEYVKRGGGLLLMYENVGLRGVFEETVFPSIAKGVRATSDRLVRPVPGYKVTSGLQQFTISYREQVRLRRGVDGVVILRNGERENVGIMGDVGAGKVVMLGWPLGVDESGNARLLSAMELKLLKNVVRWLSSEEPTPRVTEYIECRVLKPLPKRPSRVIEVHAPAGHRLRAGAAAVDITPKVGTRLAGFSRIRERFGTRISTGIHTRLYIKALVLDNGEEKVALVSWDAITGPSRAQVAEIRRRIERRTGIPGRCILINASHTHSGYKDDWVDETVEAVCRAYANMKEARLGVGSKMVYGLATATYRIRWDGRVEGLWGVNQPNPDGVVDHECGVIRVEDTHRNLIAIWVNYACVGSVIGASHSVLSGDWMGVAMAELERRYPGAVALFAQGFAGDSRSHGFRKAPSPAEADRLGKRFAEQVAQIVDHIDVRTWVPLAGRTKQIKLPGKGRRFKRELQAIVIDDCVLLATGWEIFAEIGLDIKERSPFDWTFCLELSNDSWIEYLAPKRAYLYEEETGINHPAAFKPFTAETSEVLIRESVRLIKEMHEQVKSR